MSVNAVSTASLASAVDAATQKNLVDYNSFLKLLVAQAQNQDPTNPQDSTQYLSQLASFSAVEQQTQTNAKLDALLSASRLTQADGLIGRHIASADGTASGVVASVTFSSSGLFATLTNGANVPIVDGVVLKLNAMNAADALDLFQSALWLALIGAGPPILAASVVGVLIALFQALTQIQEATLTFIPKMIAMAIVFAFTATLSGGHFSAFAEQIYARIERGYDR